VPGTSTQRWIVAGNRLPFTIRGKMIVDRPKILFVIDGLEFGGGERVFVQLVAGLRGQFDISLAATPGGKFEDKIRELGIRFYPIQMGKRASFKPVFQIKNLILSLNIDFLHSQGARADFFSRIAGRLAGLSHIFCTVAMPVDGFDVGPLRKAIYRFMDRISERYVERFIVVSDSLKRLMVEKRGIPNEKVTRIYNGIELGEYMPNGKGVRSQKSEVRREFGIAKDAPVIGAIGRMVWQKGFEYLIEAVPQTVSSIPESRFLIVGDGPLRKELVALSSELGVNEEVIFTGFRSDIRDILAAVDFLVVPSLLEGFPMITLEAMAMAKPIIATNIDGITEQIKDGENAILVPPRDPAALANAIIRVLGDRKSAQQMGMAAREKVAQEFSVEKMVSETEKVYTDLLNRHETIEN